MVGLNNLPTDGPVILATNCDRFDTCMQVVTAADRFTRFVLLESDPDERPPWPLRYLAKRTGLVALRPTGETQEAWDKALAKALKALGQGNLVGITADGSGPTPHMVELLQDLRQRTAAPILPVFCGALLPQAGPDAHPSLVRRMQVVIGHPLPEAATPEDIRQAIHRLGEWMYQQDRDGLQASTLVIPAGCPRRRRGEKSQEAGASQSNASGAGRAYKLGLSDSHINTFASRTSMPSRRTSDLSMNDCSASYGDPP